MRVAHAAREQPGADVVTEKHVGDGVREPELLLCDRGPHDVGEQVLQHSSQVPRAPDQKQAEGHEPRHCTIDPVRQGVPGSRVVVGVEPGPGGRETKPCESHLCKCLPPATLARTFALSSERQGRNQARASRLRFFAYFKWSKKSIAGFSRHFVGGGAADCPPKNVQRSNLRGRQQNRFEG